MRRRSKECGVASSRSPIFSRLPDVDALFRRQVKLVAGLNVECLVPGVDIPNDAVGPVLVGAMRVGQDLLAKRILAVLALPSLGITDEKTLVARQAVDHRRLAVL